LKRDKNSGTTGTGQQQSVKSMRERELEPVADDEVADGYSFEEEEEPPVEDSQGDNKVLTEESEKIDKLKEESISKEGADQVR